MRFLGFGVVEYLDRQVDCKPRPVGGEFHILGRVDGNRRFLIGPDHEFRELDFVVHGVRSRLIYAFLRDHLL